MRKPPSKHRRGYTLRLQESNNGSSVYLRCYDENGRTAVILPRVGPPEEQEPPPGTTLLSHGGGLLDPRHARALAAALIAFADEKQGKKR